MRPTFAEKHGSHGASRVAQVRSRSLQAVGEDEDDENSSGSSSASKEDVECGGILRNGLRVAAGWVSGAVQILDGNTGDLM